MGAGSCPKQRRYTPLSVQPLFGAAETMEATVVAILVDRGLLAYTDTVAKHWPEFGLNGKGGVTVADVMRHEGGVPFFATDPQALDAAMNYRSLTTDEALDKSIVDKALSDAPYYKAKPAITEQYAAAVAAAAAGGSDSGGDAGSSGRAAEAGMGNGGPGKTNPRVPHTLTKGMVVDGIVRRVDPDGRTYARFMKEEVCEKFGLVFCSGLSKEAQQDFKYADVKATPAAFSLLSKGSARLMGSAELKDAIKYRADKLQNPALRQVLDMVVPEGTPSTYEWANAPEARALGLGSCFVASNARSVASLNAVIANGGFMYEDGPHLFSSAAACGSILADLKPGGFGAGVEVSLSQAGVADLGSYSGVFVPDHVVSLSGWYGTTSQGGSLSMWNPTKKIGFAYCVTGMHAVSPGGTTASRLTNAMLAVLHDAAAETDAEAAGAAAAASAATVYSGTGDEAKEAERETDAAAAGGDGGSPAYLDVAPDASGDGGGISSM